MNDFPNDISRHVWAAKYRYANDDRKEQTIADTWRRVASALAAVEQSDRAGWEARFFGILRNFAFLPAWVDLLAHSRPKSPPARRAHGRSRSCFAAGFLAYSL